jgi:hypothetical protein
MMESLKSRIINESKQIKEMSFEEESKERKWQQLIKLVKSISFEPWWKIPNHASFFFFWQVIFNQ